MSASVGCSALTGQSTISSLAANSCEGTSHLEREYVRPSMQLEQRIFMELSGLHEAK